MQITLEIPEAVEAAATVKAGRTGRTPHRVLLDAFNRFMPVIADGALAYQDIAQLEGCCILTVKRLAKRGAFGKLIRRGARNVRVSLEGYMKWREGRGK